MHRFATSLTFGLLVALLNTGFAFGGTAVTKEASSGENIFSSAQNDTTVPSFNDLRGGDGKLRKMLLGNQRDGIPDWRQIKMLPSLTGPQRKEFMRMFSANKAEMQDVVEQLKALKQKTQAGGASDPAMRDSFLKLRAQVQDLRKRSWEQVKAKLTDDQLKELEAMRKGELQPATFNDPTTSMTAAPGWMKQ